MVITALGPARGFMKGFEFRRTARAASTQGVVLQSLADDLRAELAGRQASLISRPGGLSLSSAQSMGEAVNTS